MNFLRYRRLLLLFSLFTGLLSGLITFVALLATSSAPVAPHVLTVARFEGNIPVLSATVDQLDSLISDHYGQAVQLQDHQIRQYPSKMGHEGYYLIAFNRSHTLFFRLRLSEELFRLTASDIPMMLKVSRCECDTGALLRVRLNRQQRPHCDPGSVLRNRHFNFP